MRMSNLSHIQFALLFAVLIIRADGNINTSEGCQFDPDSAIFNQEENDTSPIKDWGWKWTSNFSVVPNNAGLPIYKWMPDGHMSSIKVAISNHL